MTAPAHTQSTPEEYLSIRDLCARVPYAPQTIRNLMYAGDLRLGVHYFKPTGGRVLFKWSAVQAWLEAPRGRVKGR